MGWAWSLAGLILGALIAPQFVHSVRVFNGPYQDASIIATAILAGFLAQLIGWCVALCLLAAGKEMTFRLLYTPNVDRVVGISFTNRLSMVIEWLFFPMASALLPLVGVGYGIFRYFTYVGAGQHYITVAFVGSLLIKTLLIPFVKGLVTGAIFRWFIRWLRGDKAKPKGA